MGRRRKRRKEKGKEGNGRGWKEQKNTQGEKRTKMIKSSSLLDCILTNS